MVGVTIKTADDSYLFHRLDEIEGLFQDFHISGHKCNLLNEEKKQVKEELISRGYKF